MTIREDEMLEALRRTAEDGSDLELPFEVDFFVAVPDQASGLDVAARVSDCGFRACVSHPVVKS